MIAPNDRVALPGSGRMMRPGAEEVGAPTPDTRLQVTVTLRPKKAYSSISSSRAVMPPRLSERQYLSREQFAEAYGADPKDVKKVEAFAHRYDLTLVGVSLARRTVQLSGTVAQLSEAFGSKLTNYSHEGHVFRGRTGEITIPRELSGVIHGVFGLDNRIQARPRIRRRCAERRAIRATASVSYTPPQVASLYNFPAGTNGAGQCIGIIEFGGGYQQSDLGTYFSQLGIPEPSITAVSVDGVPNQPSPGSNSPDGEVDLDIELAGAMAPGASIVVYFGEFTEQGWVDVIGTAVHDSVHKPSVISISWGYPEGQSTWTSQAMQAVNEAFQAAAAMGVTICVASGDDGSRDEVDDSEAHVDFPASSPYVLACGGTTLHSSSGAISSEVVWNDGSNGGASGGGVSAVFPVPSWQSKAGVPVSVNPGHNPGRGVPDVAADADPDTGFAVLSDGQHEVVGGTSASAPLWAALVARFNQKLGKPLGYLNPLIYPASVSSNGAFHDVTSGNNDVNQLGAYSAGPGWDACTGWGSPNGAILLKLLSSSTTTEPAPPPRKPKKPGHKPAPKHHAARRRAR
ncbi:MAG: S8/S53 family peptidase [Acidobacteriota bacterium]|nr:S8/S53 family peptidase [Acidobacteriota bacterium]